MIEVIKKIFKGSEKQADKPNGKRTLASDELIYSIWKNEESVPLFCEENEISKSKYYRIKNWEKYVLNEADRQRFKKLEKMM